MGHLTIKRCCSYRGAILAMFIANVLHLTQYQFEDLVQNCGSVIPTLFNQQDDRNRRETMAGDYMIKPDMEIVDQPRLLHRIKRDISWDDVEEFYDDKNNFAMYLVLPIIVLVYGGCAVIYCIARCRRYMKRRKRKPKRDARLEENEPLDDQEPGFSRHPHIPVISSNPNGGMTDRQGASSSSEVQVAMENGNETPLPWQVPGDKHPFYPLGATSAMKHDPEGYQNKGFDHDGYTVTPTPDAYNIKPSPPPPPSYEETYPKHRPGSRPPPYEEKGNRHRRGSVEEIITLDPLPIPPINDRKRRHPGSRPGSKLSNTVSPEKEARDYDEDRERARQLIRGENKPKLEVAPAKQDREKTPDIISHARTQPLEPRYKPTHPQGGQNDSMNMAKQAAQLLRLDHMGKQQGKKQKRLVFVAE